MKKIMTLLLCVMLTGILGACGNSDSGAEAAVNQDSQSPEVKVGDPAKRAILVVSFGTSYNDTRAITLDAIEADIAARFTDYEVRRAYTSQIIIKKLAERDKLKIDSVTEAMQRLADDGIGTLIVQPTHVMNGAEYDEMKAEMAPYEQNFANIAYGNPLLTTPEDYKQTIQAVMAEMPELTEDEGIVWMGHGTHHFANATYSALDYMFKNQGHDRVYVGTVEGFPELSDVKALLSKDQIKKVYLLPLMIVAGDHATNDMAGDEEDSWKIQLKEEGYVVEPILKGLGEYAGIQRIFADHVNEAIERMNQ